MKCRCAAGSAGSEKEDPFVCGGKAELLTQSVFQTNSVGGVTVYSAVLDFQGIDAAAHLSFRRYGVAEGDDDILVGNRQIYSEQVFAGKIDEFRREETERRITAEEYLDLLMQADTTRRQIRKSRFCLTYEQQYLEIDVYPFWQDKAILEVELPHEDTPVTLPDVFHVIKEVTDDPAYKNAALAMI